MEKRYTVFVSSTFEDLQEERKEVMQALLELDCIPAGMELFPASNDDQWTLIKRVIDDCDYYILIIGGRYGSTNDEGISYTQMEFEYALSTNKPIISFLPKHPEKIETGKTDQDPEKKKKLEEFKNLAQKKLIKFWENPENLGSIVSRSMIRLIKDFPAEGWVKAKYAIDDESHTIEINRLQRENEELKKQLEKVSTSAPKGTEELSQGNDKILINFTFLGEKNNPFDIDFHYDDCSEKIEFSWNQLFSCIAPSMIEECSENSIKSDLSNLINSNFIWSLYPDFRDFDSIHSVQIDNKSFGRIIVQLRALGLIEISQKKRTPSDKNTYWKLTPYGDYYMTQLLAIKNEDE